MELSGGNNSVEPFVFSIKIDYHSGNDKAGRVFKVMSEMIEAMETFDYCLLESFSIKIENILTLHDVEAGSIKATLRSIISSIDDDALKDLDWKKAVGSFLLKIKYLILNYLEDKPEIASSEQVHMIQELIFDSARKSDILIIPNYSTVSAKKLLNSLGRIYNSTSHLSNKEFITYISSYGEAKINKHFYISPQAIETILTEEIVKSRTTMLLRVKKPDFLGDSMWDVQYKRKTIQIKILDFEWLGRFKAREIDLLPGDSIRAIVETALHYGYDRSIIAQHFNVIKVLEIIKDQSLSQVSFDV